MAPQRTQPQNNRPTPKRKGKPLSPDTIVIVRTLYESLRVEQKRNHLLYSKASPMRRLQGYLRKKIPMATLKRIVQKNTNDCVNDVIKRYRKLMSDRKKLANLSQNEAIAATSPKKENDVKEQSREKSDESDSETESDVSGQKNENGTGDLAYFDTDSDQEDNDFQVVDGDAGPSSSGFTCEPISTSLWAPKLLLKRSQPKSTNTQGQDSMGKTITAQPVALMSNRDDGLHTLVNFPGQCKACVECKRLGRRSEAGGVRETVKGCSICAVYLCMPCFERLHFGKVTGPDTRQF